MLEAITASYKDFLDKTLQNNSKGIIVLIENARSQLKDELQKKEAEYREFRKKSMILAANETGRTFLAQRLEQSDQTAHRGAREGPESAELSSSWDGSSPARTAPLGDRACDRSARRRFDQPDRQPELEHVAVRRVRLRPPPDPGAATTGRTLRHPERAGQGASGTDHADPGAEPELAQRTRTRRDRRSAPGDRAEPEVGRGGRRRAHQAVRRVQEEARAIEITLIDESNLRTDVERQRALFNTVVDQLKQASFSQDFNSINSEIIEPANALKDPVWPKITIILPLAVMAGGLIGVGMTLVTNWMDQRIRSLAELRTMLDYSVLGQILQLPEDQRVGIDEFGLISQVTAALGLGRGVPLDPDQHRLPPPQPERPGDPDHQSLFRRWQERIGEQPGDQHGQGRPKGPADRRRPPQAVAAQGLRPDQGAGRSPWSSTKCSRCPR